MDHSPVGCDPRVDQLVEMAETFEVSIGRLPGLSCALVLAVALAGCGPASLRSAAPSSSATTAPAAIATATTSPIGWKRLFSGRGDSVQAPTDWSASSGSAFGNSNPPRDPLGLRSGDLLVLVNVSTGACPSAPPGGPGSHVVRVLGKDVRFDAPGGPPGGRPWTARGLVDLGSRCVAVFEEAGDSDTFAAGQSLMDQVVSTLELGK